MIRTLIVDDSGTIRQAVQDVLKRYSQIEILGEAANGAAAVEKARSMEVDLVLMDVSMPLVDGFTAAEEIKLIRPGAKIIIFSMHRMNELVQTARMLGFDAYAFKEEITSLINAIETVLSGRTYFPRAETVFNSNGEQRTAL